MSLTAVYDNTLPHAPREPAYMSSRSSRGSVLVVGSPSTASDGQYQSLVTSMGASNVERQMVDRLLDGATSPGKSHFSSAYVVLARSDYDYLAERIPTLISLLHTCLSPDAALYFYNSPPRLRTQLSSAGFDTLVPEESANILAVKKPAISSPLTSGTASSLAMPLPRRGKSNTASQAAKKALWSFSSPATPTIDAESLLTPSDRQNPTTSCDTTAAQSPRKRKKACKNCTCGLAELEAEELKNSSVVLLTGSEEGSAQAMKPGEWIVYFLLLKPALKQPAVAEAAIWVTRSDVKAVLT